MPFFPKLPPQFPKTTTTKAMSTKNTTTSRPHVLVIPFPAQGHLLPLLDFAHHLSLRQHLPITVAVTPANLQLLASFLASTPSASPLVLPLPPHPSFPTAAEHSRLLPPATHHALLALPLSSLHAPLLSWASSHPHPPSLLISDFFLGCTQLLADELGIPRVTFYSSGAFATAALDHLWRNTPVSSNGPVLLTPLPGSPAFPYEQVPSVVRRYVAGDPDWEFVREGFLLNARSWGAVVNTFEAMEGEFVEYLKGSYGHGRVWAVGPVSATGPQPAAGGRGGESSVEAERLLSWLGSCPPRSVVYVCFGSQYTPPPAQAAALAAALEESGARFVWAVGEAAAVPDGFGERIVGRGFVLRGWAPQVEILSHRAAGAFVTHCGWNSTLEGVAAGAALVAWPMVADQFIDARLLVEGHGVAVRAAEGADAVPDVAELARILAEAVDETKWTQVRARARGLAAAAAAAAAEGGSSWLDFQRMVKEFEAVAEKK